MTDNSPGDLEASENPLLNEENAVEGNRFNPLTYDYSREAFDETYFRTRVFICGFIYQVFRPFSYLFPAFISCFPRCYFYTRHTLLGIETGHQNDDDEKVHQDQTTWISTNIIVDSMYITPFILWPIFYDEFQGLSAQMMLYTVVVTLASAIIALKFATRSRFAEERMRYFTSRRIEEINFGWAPMLNGFIIQETQIQMLRLNIDSNEDIEFRKDYDLKYSEDIFELRELCDKASATKRSIQLVFIDHLRKIAPIRTGKNIGVFGAKLPYLECIIIFMFMVTPPIILMIQHEGTHPAPYIACAIGLFTQFMTTLFLIAKMEYSFYMQLNRQEELFTMWINLFDNIILTPRNLGLWKKGFHFFNTFAYRYIIRMHAQFLTLMIFMWGAIFYMLVQIFLGNLDLVAISLSTFFVYLFGIHALQIAIASEIFVDTANAMAFNIRDQFLERIQERKVESIQEESDMMVMKMHIDGLVEYLQNECGLKLLGIFPFGIAGFYVVAVLLYFCFLLLMRIVLCEGDDSESCEFLKLMWTS